MCSVRRAVTNNMLKNMPQTSTVFYLAQRGYSSAQSICNWHWLNKKLQPSKDPFSVGCKSTEFAIGFDDNRLCSIKHHEDAWLRCSVQAASSSGLQELPAPAQEDATSFRTVISLSPNLMQLLTSATRLKALRADFHENQQSRWGNGSGQAGKNL